MDTPVKKASLDDFGLTENESPADRTARIDREWDNERYKYNKFMTRYGDRFWAQDVHNRNKGIGVHGGNREGELDWYRNMNKQLHQALNDARMYAIKHQGLNGPGPE